MQHCASPCRLPRRRRRRQTLKCASGRFSKQAHIRQISEDWIRFYNAGDAAKVAALYTDDGYYLSAHILAHGRQAIQAYWERGIKPGGHIEFIKPLTVYYAGDLAYCPGTYQATDGRILIVLRKVNGRMAHGRARDGSARPASGRARRLTTCRLRYSISQVQSERREIQTCDFRRPVLAAFGEMSGGKGAGANDFSGAQRFVWKSL